MTNVEILAFSRGYIIGLGNFCPHSFNSKPNRPLNLNLFLSYGLSPRNSRQMLY
jgi:hypothetical protein